MRSGLGVPALQHLRVVIALVVDADEHVVDQVGEDPRGVYRRNDRVEYLQLGIQRGAHGAVRGAGLGLLETSLSAPTGQGPRPSRTKAHRRWKQAQRRPAEPCPSRQAKDCHPRLADVDPTEAMNGGPSPRLDGGPGPSAAAFPAHSIRFAGELRLLPVRKVQLVLDRIPLERRRWRVARRIVRADASRHARDHLGAGSGP